ncbi:MAG: acyl-CoA dehydrogenase family protein [Gammaproteobacteria bacterium]|nr:acyl-CoA dehydrogenase family protein [Gammaproteobacteria bacterium]
MIPRTIFSAEHETFRDSVRRFVAREIVPYHAQWEHDGMVSREIWRAAGTNGFLCTIVPDQYGGPGGDFLHTAIVTEELARVEASGPAFHLHSGIVAPYLLLYGSEEQKLRWLPRMCAGEIIGAIAMTEPDAGSDLRGIRTRAVHEGNDFILNGQKTFISNGQIADLIITACRTGQTEGAKGISLFLVAGDDMGFRRGRNLDKIGWHAQDTSELFFSDVRLAADRLLGGENRGFHYLMQQLAQERLLIAIRATMAIEAALDTTIAYTKDRHAFGRTLIEFQNTRFTLAEVKTQAAVVRSFVDRCIELHMQDALDANDAAMAKLSSTEALGRVLDQCLQLHGGNGCMWDYPIARAWAGHRMSRIAGGSSEIMKEIIGRTL